MIRIVWAIDRKLHRRPCCRVAQKPTRVIGSQSFLARLCSHRSSHSQINSRTISPCRARRSAHQFALSFPHDCLPSQELFSQGRAALSIETAELFLGKHVGMEIFNLIFGASRPHIHCGIVDQHINPGFLACFALPE